MPTLTRELTENDKTAIIGALHVAAARYDEDAKIVGSDPRGGVERLVDQFTRQAEAARALAVRLEDAEVLLITEDESTELTRRFPELESDEELNGGDAVDRLADWHESLKGK